MSLDPEQLEQLSEAVNNLTQVMSAMPSALAGVMGKSEALGKAFVSAGGSVDKYAKAMQDAEEEKARRDGAIREAHYLGVAALRSFTGALQDSSADLKKYSNTVSTGFDALSTIATLSGTKFGLALSGLAKVTGFAGEQLLAYNSRLVNAYQSLAQFGIGAGITSEEIAKLGRDSNFSGEQLQTFSKVMGQAGADLLSLGGTVTEGMKMFGKFTAVGDKVARQLNYLGISTEQYLEYQQKFLRQEISAGLATGRGEAAMNKLTQASLQLYTEMMKQAQLTGASVEKQMEEREYLSSITNYRLYNLKRIQDVQRQEDVLGKEETARRIQNIKDESRIMLENATLLSTQAGRDVAQSFLRRASTEGVGALASDADVMSERLFQEFGGMTGVIRESKIAAQQGLSYTTQLQSMIYKSGERVIDLIGEQTYFSADVMDDLRKIYGGTDEVLTFMTRRILDESNLTTQQRQGEYNRQREIVEQGIRQRLKEAESISMATDAAMIMATTLYEKERQFRKAMDEGLATINKPFVTLAVVATGAIMGIVAFAGAALWAANQIRKAPWGQLPGTGPINPSRTPQPEKGPKPDSIILGPDGKPLPKEPEAPAPEKPSRPSRGGRLGRLGRLGSPLSLFGGLAVGAAADYAYEEDMPMLGAGLDIAGTTAEYAGYGGLIGSALPIVGTGVGAGVGATAGLIKGTIDAVTNYNKLQNDKIPPVDLTEETETKSTEAKPEETATTTAPREEKPAEITSTTAAPKEEKPSTPVTPEQDITKEMSNNELRAQVALTQRTLEITGQSNRSAQETQQLFSAYMERLATAQERREYEVAQENLRRSNNQVSSGDFTLELQRAFARSRISLQDATNEFTSGVLNVTAGLFDFKTASFQATRNLRDIAGITILDMQAEDDNTITIDQDSIDKLASVIPRAYFPGSEGDIKKSGVDFSYRPGFEDLPAEVDAFLRMTRDKESSGGQQLRVKDFANATTIGGQYGMGQSAREAAFKNLTSVETERLKTLGVTSAPNLDTLVMPDGKTFREGMDEVDNILAKSYARLTLTALKGKIKDREVTASDMRGAWWHGVETYSRILDESIKNPNMLVSEFYRQQGESARKQGRQYVMPDVSQFKGRTLKGQLDYIAQQVSSVETYKTELPSRRDTNVDAFGRPKGVTDPFDLVNVSKSLELAAERDRARLGLPDYKKMFGNDVTNLDANGAPSAGPLIVSTNKDMPLITVDPTTNSNFTSLIDLNKIQTSELSALNSKISELNTKIDTLNDTQRKLLTQTQA